MTNLGLKSLELAYNALLSTQNTVFSGDADTFIKIVNAKLSFVDRCLEVTNTYYSIVAAFDDDEDEYADDDEDQDQRRGGRNLG